jgi:hypothetical protein
MKITPTSVASHRSNLPAVLASTTTSHIGYLNRLTNFAWTPLSRVVLLNGYLTKSTLIMFIRDSNCEIFRPNQFAAPAATIHAFVNGAIGARLPSHDRWVAAYAADPECCVIRDLIVNPGKICKDTLKNVHYSYRHPI